MIIFLKKFLIISLVARYRARYPECHNEQHPVNNQNHCFIESHDKVLDEQQAANEIIIKRQQEQNTIVNQLKKMIVIETI
jgi:hypothetical protein